MSRRIVARPPVPSFLTHVHSCGHRDGCYFLTSRSQVEPCSACREKAAEAKAVA